jgi:ABC-2 type transport system ATP-binding protein
MDEAQELADHVAIISSGRIVAEGTPADLIGRTGATRVTFRTSGAVSALPAALRTLAQVTNGTVTIETTEPTPTLHLLTSWALENGIELSDLAVSRRTLEDVYLELTVGPASEESVL